jgi:hypothetical protein
MIQLLCFVTYSLCWVTILDYITFRELTAVLSPAALNGRCGRRTAHTLRPDWLRCPPLPVPPRPNLLWRPSTQCECQCLCDGMFCQLLLCFQPGMGTAAPPVFCRTLRPPATPRHVCLEPKRLQV